MSVIIHIEHIPHSVALFNPHFSIYHSSITCSFTASLCCTTAPHPRPLRATLQLIEQSCLSNLWKSRCLPGKYGWWWALTETPFTQNKYIRLFLLCHICNPEFQQQELHYLENVVFYANGFSPILWRRPYQQPKESHLPPSPTELEEPRMEVPTHTLYMFVKYRWETE